MVTGTSARDPNSRCPTVHRPFAVRRPRGAGV